VQGFKIIFQPGAISQVVEAGTSIMEAINRAGMGNDFPCGGMGKCGKCCVRVLEGLGTPTDGDLVHLSAEELVEGIRLACMNQIQGDMVVEILNHKKLEHNILTDSADRLFHIQPHLKKICTEVSSPSLSAYKSDWQRLKEALSSHGFPLQELDAQLSLLRLLPDTVRQSKNRVTSVLYGSKVLGVEHDDTTCTMLGMAFDIGTTTIVGYLMDLISGEELAVVSTLNPQAQFGADVISRITFAGSHEGALEKLHNAVTEAINRLIGEAAEKAGKGRNDIYGVSVAANTTMHHLFLGINPRNIAVSPYVSVVNQGLVLNAGELGLDINGAGQVFVLPNIAGFVGADTTAVLLAAELDMSEHIKLIVDIGTNGEIALGNKRKIVACSAAAGPAFEGAQISCGMRGAVGAIDHIWFGAGLEYTVIGGGSPVGICGSALLDGVAGLVELGIIDKRGRFIDPEKIINPRAVGFKDRLIKHEGFWAFLLEDSAKTGHERPIMITQKDIRELQLAKGAMAAGVRVLMESCSVQFKDIKEVLLAGAFGNYLNPHSACVVGLIPQELENKIRMIGNAAGTGAKLALQSAGEFSRADDLAASVTFVELGSYPKFNNIFAENTYFTVRLRGGLSE
jgi:uncharacterized 2Fe-2S/4Fe-4S cluster protein (DUF4445 family)